MQKIKFEFCEKEDGVLYIRDFLDDLSEEVYEKVTVKLGYFEQYTPRLFLKSKHTEPLDKKTGLYEVKLKVKNHWYRFLGKWEDEVFYIITAFKKKSNKTPSKHIETANNRLDEYFN